MTEIESSQYQWLVFLPGERQSSCSQSSLLSLQRSTRPVSCVRFGFGASVMSSDVRPVVSK